jgi:hypothetical protein
MRSRGRPVRDLLRLGQTAQWRGWSRVNDIAAVEERPGRNEAGLPHLQAPRARGARAAPRCSAPISSAAARRGRGGDWRHDRCPDGPPSETDRPETQPILKVDEAEDGA